MPSRNSLRRGITRYAALCLIMPVIEAQCASILVPHDHRHINQMRMRVQAHPPAARGAAARAD